MKEFLTPIQAIREKCLECSNGNKDEIRDCLIETCPLYVFRIAGGYRRKTDDSEQLSLDNLNME